MISVMQRDAEWMQRQCDLRHGERLPGRISLVATRKRHFEIRKRAKAAIDYLASSAVLLPEDQQVQIFNLRNLRDLIVGLFSVSGDQEKTDSECKRKLELCNYALSAISSGYNAGVLAPEYGDAIIRASAQETFPFDSVPRIKAILYEASMRIKPRPENDEEKITAERKSQENSEEVKEQ